MQFQQKETACHEPQRSVESRAADKGTGNAGGVKHTRRDNR
jgi:hypothetical protein